MPRYAGFLVLGMFLVGGFGMDLMTQTCMEVALAR